MDLTTIISNGLTLVADWGIPFFSALAGVGIVSMAMLQVFKDFCRIEPRFNRREIEQWFGVRTKHDATAKQQLLLLAAGGNDVALYELPTPALMNQLAAASRVALAFPLEFSPLLRGLAGEAAAGDIDTVIQVAREDARRRERLAAGEPPSENLADIEREARRHRQLQEDAEQARVRIVHLTERGLDTLQITLASRWELGNKWAAFALSWLVTVATFVIYLYVQETAPAWTFGSTFRFVLTTVATATLAAFVAPVAKDLVAALQRLRGTR